MYTNKYTFPHVMTTLYKQFFCNIEDNTIKQVKQAYDSLVNWCVSTGNIRAVQTDHLCNI